MTLSLRNLIAAGLVCALQQSAFAEDQIVFPKSKITAGFHKRIATHPSGAIEAACIGMNPQGTPQNPLGDRTKLLESSPAFPRHFTADSGDLSTIRLELPNPVLKVTFEDFRDVRGPIKLVLFDAAGKEVSTLAKKDDVYMVSGDDLPVAAVVGSAQIAPPGKSKNAGAHFVAVVEMVDISIALTRKDEPVLTEDPVERTSIADGATADYEIQINPEGYIGLVAIREVRVKHQGLVRNPSGQLSQFQSVDPGIDLNWKLANARWIEQNPPCHDVSFQDLEVVWNFKRLSHLPGKDFIKVRPGYVGIDAVYGRNDAVLREDRAVLVKAAAQYNDIANQMVSGQLEIVELAPGAGVFTGNFKLVVDLQSDSTVELLPASQYYAMTLAEEQFHERKQQEDPAHAHWVAAGLPRLIANINADFQMGMPYPSEADAYATADTVIRIRVAEVIDAWGVQALFCAREREAKAAANATHLNAMPCAYPACQ